MKLENLIKQLKIIVLQLQVLLTHAKLTIPNLPGPKEIVVHYGAGNLTFEQVNIYHRRKWGFKSSLGFYIGYTVFIDFDGIVHKGRADNERGAHCVEKGRPNYWNDNALGPCLQGDGTNHTEAQLKSLKKYLDRKRIKYGIPYSKVHGHRDIKSTACPSDKVYNWLQDYKNQA